MKYAVEELVLESRCQARAEIRPEAVEDYAAAYAAKTKLPPIAVFIVGDAPYVVDGFHRVAAALKSGVSFLEVVQVGRGSIDDAAWYATGVNQSHGVRRSNADKRKAVLMALETPAGREASSAAIAKHCGVSDMLVSGIRREWELARMPQHQELDVEPPKRRGVDGKMRKPRAAADRQHQELDVEVAESTPTDDIQHRVSDVEPPGYGPLLTKAANQIKRLRVSLRAELENVPSFAQQTERLLKDAEMALRLGIPEVCPRCGGAKCDQCAQRGWVGKGLAEQIRARGKT
jgi:hypothetical protein